MNIDIKAVGWLETVEFVDISEAIIREASFFAYPKAPSTGPLHIHSQSLALIGDAIRMNGELPEGIFLRKKYSEPARITKPDEFAKLRVCYETAECRCLKA
ncbi:MAG: hypothetical protein WAM53_05535 [Terrimicrobiaceae bacterium]